MQARKSKQPHNICNKYHIAYELETQLRKMPFELKIFVLLTIVSFPSMITLR